MGVVVYAARQYAGTGTAWTVVLVGVGGVVYLVALTGLSQRFRTTVKRNLPTVR